jgi:hypothetical protein
MTFAPPTILAVRALLMQDDSDLSMWELGIVGGPSHVRQATSYHLGRDQLDMSKNPYSARTARDLAGLSNAASALDIDDDWDFLRQFSVWLVQECQNRVSDTLDIREVIYSPDGVQVLRWDRERGGGPFPDSDTSHRTHTHISWYRDSEFRDKTGPFKRFLQGVEMADIDMQYLAPRVEAITYLYDNIRVGPETGTPVPVVELLKELTVPQPAPVDIPALVEALKPVIRDIVREELDDTKLGPA